MAGRTIFITGASRGIGKAIALKCARDGANIVVAAKTAEPHPKLPGTIYTAAKEIEDAGGKALPCIVDIRDENAVSTAVEQVGNLSNRQTKYILIKYFHILLQTNTKQFFFRLLQLSEELMFW